ncbi:anti-anti-sigma regulatory factor [Actinomadura coerulea]|uniref:Anti-anti-sigma regulatory factor n=1 Tax=Actinomadura coerulea TaxID=46159 RepID=A0A7X0L2G2_9ACTN|nr:anti-anti-sigma regulatory factor [Actinomadura coerulea]GGQ13330.1 hypothetical protein GCM10010187_32100 [Actinomadura coerulea]
MLRLLNTGVPALVLDLTGTRFCGASGVNVIVRTHLRAKALTTPLVLAVPETGSVRRVFEITEVSELVPTASDLAAACELACTRRTAGSLSAAQESS